MLKTTLKANYDFFAKLELGELFTNGYRQRVLVKRFANKTVSMIPTWVNRPNLFHRNGKTRRRSGRQLWYLICSFSCFSILPDVLSRHANLPQLARYSNDRSAMQFILFHDTYFTSQHPTEIRSLAAFLVQGSRLHDVFWLTNTIVDFVSILCG